MTQNTAVLRHLRTHATLTPIEALRAYGIFRLAARVWELRALGHDIRATEVALPTGARIAVYSLVEEPEQIGAGL